MLADPSARDATAAPGVQDVGGRLIEWGYLWYQVRRSPLTIAGIVILLVAGTAIAFAPYIAPFDPYAVDLRARLAAPGAEHWFGTDEVGRDLFSRVVYGARASVGVGFAIVTIAASCGTIIGCFTGLMGGRTDTAIMRVMDVILSFPSLVLSMALAAALGPSLFNAMLAVAFVRIPFYVRLARGQALSLRERAYVKAAHTFGASVGHVLRRHIAPNAMSPIIVQATLDLGSAILTAAALSFIGLGAQQPTAEWGAMVSTGRNFLLDQWWYPTFPGLAILITAIGFNLFGDGLRDMLDPRLKAQ
jgi:peptide/nickel transport system permease protein